MACKPKMAMGGMLNPTRKAAVAKPAGKSVIKPMPFAKGGMVKKAKKKACC